MSSAKSASGSTGKVWSESHYDLGEIRTELADRSTPPEKKERLGEKGSEPKTPRKLQGAGYKYICYWKFFSNSYQVLTQEFFK